MMRSLSVAAVLIAAAGPFAAAQDGVSVKPEPGLWKVLLKFTQNGQPLPDKTESICYSAAQFDDLVATFATPFPDHDCTRNHTMAGQSLTLTATVTSTDPGLTGTVNFFDGATLLGIGTVNGAGVLHSGWSLVKIFYHKRKNKSNLLTLS